MSAGRGTTAAALLAVPPSTIYHQRQQQPQQAQPPPTSSIPASPFLLPKSALAKSPSPLASASEQRDEELAESVAELFAFSPELESAVAGVLQTKEPLDQQDFNPIAYINHIFPNEQSLASIDVVLRKLRIKIRKLDREIKELVRDQTDAGSQGVAELEAAKTAIQELFVRIKQIKEKAQQSEQMVQEITHDIKSLDFAKRHLTTSITALKRLQMLVTAVDQLRTMSSRKQYKEAGQLLQAVLQLLSHFISYKNIKQISDLSDSITVLQADLRKQIFEDFEKSFTNQGAFTGNAQTLLEACSVIDTLGKDAKNQLIDWYCEVQLKQYRAIFGDFTSEVAALDNTSRRYAWLKRFLKTYDEEHVDVFPKTWNVSDIVCEKFCEQTKRDLRNVLASMQKIDVKLLLKTLQQTIEFEGGLAKRFARQDVAALSAKDITPLSPTAASPTSPLSPTAQPFRSFKMLSSCFEPYLSHYIESEDIILAEMIEGYKQQPPASDEDSTIQVMSSSTDLFYFYRETLVHCSTLSTGKPFLDLCKLFGKWLFSYGNDILLGKLPKEDKKPVTTEELKAICLILNTADYCHTTTSHLEEKLKEKIDAKYKEEVTLQHARELFLNALTQSIKSLVRGVESTLDAPLANMCKVPWGTLESVGDQSEYVTSIVSNMSGAVATIRAAIAQNKYFRTFCDKFVESFIPKFMANVQKCRPISEVGAEQMLLDTHAVKTALLELPTIGASGPATGVVGAGAAPATYTKIVTKGLGKVETLLKVVMTPPDPPEGLVETYIMILADNSLANFQKVLELKGLKKSEQQPLIEAFQYRLPAPPSGSQPTALTTSAANPFVASLLPSVSSSSSSASQVPTSLAPSSKSSMPPSISAPLASMSAPLSTLSASAREFGASTAGASTKFNENFRKFVGGFNMKRGDTSAGTSAAGAAAGSGGKDASTASAGKDTTKEGASTFNSGLKRLF